MLVALVHHDIPSFDPAVEDWHDQAELLAATRTGIALAREALGQHADAVLKLNLARDALAELERRGWSLDEDWDEYSPARSAAARLYREASAKIMPPGP